MGNTVSYCCFAPPQQGKQRSGQSTSRYLAKQGESSKLADLLKARFSTASDDSLDFHLGKGSATLGGRHSNVATETNVLSDEEAESQAKAGYPWPYAQIGPPRAACEPCRVQALEALDSINPPGDPTDPDPPADPEVDSILKLVCSIFNAPVAMLNICYYDRVWKRDATGIFPRGHLDRKPGFCPWGTCASQTETLIIQDTLLDARFSTNPFVVNPPGVRFYCGAPIIASNGHRLGNLCFLDFKPRELDAASCMILNNLAEVVVRHLEKDLAMHLKQKENLELEAAYAKLQRTLDCVDHCLVLLDTSVPGWQMLYMNEAWNKVTGTSREELQNRLLSNVMVRADGWSLPLDEHAHSAAQNQPFIIEDASLRDKQGRKLRLSFRPATKDRIDEFSIPIGIPAFVPSESQKDSVQQPQRYFFMAVDEVIEEAVQQQEQQALIPLCRDPAPDFVSGLHIGHLLGRGGYGRVYFGRWFGSQVAIKIIDQDVRTATTESGFVSLEALLGGQLKHPHVVATLRHFTRCVPRGKAPSGPADLAWLGKPFPGATAMAVAAPAAKAVLPALPATAAAATTVSSSPEATAVAIAATATTSLPHMQSAKEAVKRAGSVGAGPHSGPNSRQDAMFQAPLARPISFTDISSTDKWALPANGANKRGGKPATGTADAAVINSAGAVDSVLVNAATPKRTIALGIQACPQVPGSNTSNRLDNREIPSAASYSASLDDCSFGPRSSMMDSSVAPTSFASNSGYATSKGPESMVSDRSVFVPASLRTPGREAYKRSAFNSSAAASYTSSRASASSQRAVAPLASSHCGCAAMESVADDSYECEPGNPNQANGVQSLQPTAVDGSSSESPRAHASYEHEDTSPSTSQGGENISPFSTDAATDSHRGRASCTTLSSSVVNEDLDAPVEISGQAISLFSLSTDQSRRAGISRNLTDQENDIGKSQSVQKAATVQNHGCSHPEATHSNHGWSVQPEVVYHPETSTDVQESLRQQYLDVQSAQEYPEQQIVDGQGVQNSKSTVSSWRPDTSQDSRGETNWPMFNAQEVAQTNPTSAMHSAFTDTSHGSLMLTSVAQNCGPYASASETSMQYETWLLLEFCDRGCLQDAIERGWLRTRPTYRHSPNLPAILATATEVASAMTFLHGRGIIHGDLSAYNVMLCSGGSGVGIGNRNFVAKVGDFGLARALDVRSCIQTRTYGTITHMPPELLSEGILSKAVDVFSFGVLLWQMYTGSRPWVGLTHGQLIHTLVSGSAQLQFSTGSWQPYVELAERCMSRDADSRPTFEDILLHLAALQAMVAGGEGVGAR